MDRLPNQRLASAPDEDVRAILLALCEKPGVETAALKHLDWLQDGRKNGWVAGSSLSQPIAITDPGSSSQPSPVPASDPGPKSLPEPFQARCVDQPQATYGPCTICGVTVTLGNNGPRSCVKHTGHRVLDEDKRHLLRIKMQREPGFTAADMLAWAPHWHSWSCCMKRSAETVCIGKPHIVVARKNVKREARSDTGDIGSPAAKKKKV